MTPITEQEILAAIKEVEVEQKEARQAVAFHKKAAVDAETRLIAANLQFEKLKEQLRVYRIVTPRHEDTPRDAEIERFRTILPDLIKKLEELDKKKEVK